MAVMAAAYPWLKALHIISVISWMAGLLYMPRLFVYHSQVVPGSETSELFKVMERRLYKAIMTPAMVSTVLFGVLLLTVPGLVDWHAFWIWGKLTLILGLIASHFGMKRWKDAFAADSNPHPTRFFRVMNEVPTLLMIGVVILVVVKP